jgi:hypothetical protein
MQSYLLSKTIVVSMSCTCTFELTEDVSAMKGFVRGEVERQKTRLDAGVYCPPMRETRACYVRAATPGADVSDAALLSPTPVTADLTASALTRRKVYQLRGQL